MSAEPSLHYVIVEDERTLACAASVGCIEIHPFLHTMKTAQVPAENVGGVLPLSVSLPGALTLCFAFRARKLEANARRR
jgi:hypothetical protein